MGFKADDIFDFIYHTIRFCAWQIDFVDDRKDIQVMVKGKIYICQCLGFDSLSCIYYQDCTVAGCKASGYFVIEVYMAGVSIRLKMYSSPSLALYTIRTA